MDLNHAIAKHVDWKIKFRAAIANQETVDQHAIARDDRCELGIWLYGDARETFGTFASYAECVTQHATFHREAALVAEAINSRHFQRAEAMLSDDTPYTKASMSVCGAILRLKKEAAL